MTIKICPECTDPIKEHDIIIEVKDDFYHEDCVELYPTGYVAYTKDHDYIGETENDAGESAWMVLDEGEYEGEE